MEVVVEEEFSESVMLGDAKTGLRARAKINRSENSRVRDRICDIAKFEGERSSEG